jgi:hypothetical protein
MGSGSNASGRHTRAAYLRSWSSQGLPTVLTRRSVHGQHVVINGIRIYFAETGDAFVFAQERAEHSLADVIVRAFVEER